MRRGAEQRIGVKREDMPWVEHEFEEEFRQYIAEFSTRQRPQIIAALEDAVTHRDVRVHMLTSREKLRLALADAVMCAGEVSEGLQGCE